MEKLSDQNDKSSNLVENEPLDLEGSICTSCGLCCDGTIFEYVSIHKNDHVSHYGNLKIQLDDTEASGDESLFYQPCPEFDCEIGCKIYNVRPNTCREFRCHLLMGVTSGETTEAQATEIIEKAKNIREGILVEISKTISFIQPKSVSEKLNYMLRNDNSDSTISVARRKHANTCLQYGLLWTFLNKHFWPMDDKDES